MSAAADTAVVHFLTSSDLPDCHEFHPPCHLERYRNRALAASGIGHRPKRTLPNVNIPEVLRPWAQETYECMWLGGPGPKNHMRSRGFEALGPDSI